MPHNVTGRGASHRDRVRDGPGGPGPGGSFSGALCNVPSAKPQHGGLGFAAAALLFTGGWLGFCPAEEH